MCPTFAKLKSSAERQVVLDAGVAEGLFDRLYGPNEYGTWMRECYFAAENA